MPLFRNTGSLALKATLLFGLAVLRGPVMGLSALPLTTIQRQSLNRGDVLTHLQRHEKGGTLTVIGWIEAPPAQVWKALANTSFQKVIYPSLISSAVLRVEPDGSEVHRAVFDFPWPFDDRWSLHRAVKYPSTCTLSWEREDGTLTGNTGSWTLYQSEDGKSTLLYYRVFFDPGLPLIPESLIQYGMKKEAPGIVTHLRRFLTNPTAEFRATLSEMNGSCAVERKI